MLNAKKRMKVTVCIWIAVLLLAIATFATHSHAAEGKISDKEIAVVIMWYTADGHPHNIFIVDINHFEIINNAIVVIDRTPGKLPHDQVLIGGMFDFQYFGYYQVFDLQTGRLSAEKLKFAQQFQARAGERLQLVKQKKGLQ